MVVVGNSGQNVRSASVRILIITNTEIQNFKQIKPAHSTREARHQISDTTQLNLCCQGRWGSLDQKIIKTEIISERFVWRDIRHQTSDIRHQTYIPEPILPRRLMLTCSVATLTGLPRVLAMIKTINFLLILSSAPWAMASQARNILR